MDTARKYCRLDGLRSRMVALVVVGLFALLGCATEPSDGGLAFLTDPYAQRPLPAFCDRTNLEVCVIRCRNGVTHHVYNLSALSRYDRYDKSSLCRDLRLRR